MKEGGQYLIKWAWTNRNTVSLITDILYTYGCSQRPVSYPRKYNTKYTALVPSSNVNLKRNK